VFSFFRADKCRDVSSLRESVAVEAGDELRVC
jgi:hypothetical protein